MNIVILTQPIRTNYGGILQAYALQKLLLDMGHEVLTDNPRINYSKRKTLLFFKIYRIIKKYILHKKKVIIFQKMYDNKTQLFLKEFVAKNIRTIDFDNEGNVESIDAFIVGSDQVWRPIYAENINKYFLGFTENSDVCRLSYAASFGRGDVSEFIDEEIVEYSSLLKKFDAISVREDSGISLCEKHFGVNAIHVLDPTMLLDIADYNKLIDKNEPIHENIVTCYILDKCSENDSIVSIVEKELNIIKHEISVRSINPDDGIENCTFPSISHWIAGYRDAQFVVTDSFHGTVFSIIFNKPFISIANKGRGLSRFTSLLKLFDLEDRLIFSDEELTGSHFKPIDWNKVNDKLEGLREKSMCFLKDNLRNE